MVCGCKNNLYLVPPPPEDVVVMRFDSTSIGVSWTKYTLVELKGLASYIIIDSRMSWGEQSLSLGHRIRSSIQACRQGGALAPPFQTEIYKQQHVKSGAFL